ncbi:unnamed protein product [Calypogeia fissa]
MAKEIPRLKSKVAKLKGEGDDRIEAMLKLVSEKETLEQNQRDLAKETIREREIASQAVCMKDEAEASISQYKDEVQRLSRSVITLEGQIRQKDALQAHQDLAVQALSLNCNNLRESIWNYQNDCADLDAQVKKANQDAMNANDRVEGLTKRIKDLEARLSAALPGPSKTATNTC